MKVYVKPTIDFIELKPEERLACASGDNNNYQSDKGFNDILRLISLWNRISNRNSKRKYW